MKTDIEIAQSVVPRPIGEIAEKLGVPADMLEPYGYTKAKINTSFLRQSPRDRKSVM